MFVKGNVTANFAGSIWLALMSLAFVPLYIRLMGVESYGIVGVLISLQAIFALLDLGLSQTLAREMARLSAHPDFAAKIGDTARTFEFIYWGLALVVTATIAFLAHFIAYYWLNPDQLSRENLREILWIGALVLGLRWPIALYIGALNGMQRQVLVNGMLAGFATLQGLGALGALWFIAPTVQVFFWWQALIAMIQVLALRVILWDRLPKQGSRVFSLSVLKRTWRFAAGITGITLLATLLSQLDKVLLSKMLSLTDFGYYVFAASVAAALQRLIAPVFTAYSPRLTELVSKNDRATLIETYHQGCQVMAVVILAPTLTLVFFTKEILSLWTHDQSLVIGTQLLVSILVIGNALNGLVTMPYALQLAHGWTKLALYTNATAAIVLVPVIYFATLYWGAVGAASVWVVLNLSYLVIGMHLMHRRIIETEKWRWYVSDIAMPLVAGLLVVTIGRMVIQNEWSAVPKLLMLCVVTGLGTVATVFSADLLRHRLAPKLFSMRADRT